ncbi:MAG TPA: class I SAM-dependent methyltransferase [Gaiellaceae bacterium]|nr:class I SAM-dependent methyltransferase [Gaiellaceae bacterium]
MSFAVAADAYDRFMGRYSKPLAPRFLDFARVQEGPVLDVGCGPGALTTTLLDRFGEENVSAADPSEPFVVAARERHTGVRVELAPAETMPFADDEFGGSLAQLVVHFMTDPVAGLREMARVTHPNGVVAACVWDLAGGDSPLSPFWDAARELDPNVVDESGRPGARAGHLAELFGAAGLRDIEAGAVTLDVEHESFEEYWEPFALGVGPAGSYLASLDRERQAAVRERCRTSLPGGAFALHLRAWAARGVV